MMIEYPGMDMATFKGILQKHQADDYRPHATGDKWYGPDGREVGCVIFGGAIHPHSPNDKYYLRDDIQ